MTGPQRRGLIAIGDPALWFSGKSLNGATSDLHVNAGRWIVLAFFDARDPAVPGHVRQLVSHVAATSEDHLVVYCLLRQAPPEIAALAANPAPALRFVADEEGAIARLYGVEQMPCSIVLDPMLRVVAVIPANHPSGHDPMLQQVIASLPRVDDAAGVPLSAPALIVPRVLDFDLCDLLVRLYDQMGGEDSGFLLDTEGKTATIVDHRLKRRRDLLIVVPELRERIRDQIVRRLLPAIERYYHFTATRMDRYLVSCYDSREGGHFFRHRDNVNAGAEHRRFAVSINLNRDYDGCDLVFPEFGRRAYRAPVGGAIVFSCGALHEVTPVSRGRRYAFLPFLYGEADAQRREANNARLAVGSALYHAGDDLLYPAAVAAQ